MRKYQTFNDSSLRFKDLHVFPLSVLLIVQQLDKTHCVEGLIVSTWSLFKFFWKCYKPKNQSVYPENNSNRVLLQCVMATFDFSKGSEYFLNPCQHSGFLYFPIRELLCNYKVSWKELFKED